MNEDPRVLPGCSVLPPMLTHEERRQRTGRAATSRTAAQPKGKRNTRNRFAVLNAFADCGARLFGTTAQACWWIIFRETNPDGLTRIAHRRIAECIGTSRRTVLRALAELEAARLLIVVRRGDFHRRTSSIYRLRPTPPDG